MSSIFFNLKRRIIRRLVGRPIKFYYKYRLGKGGSREIMQFIRSAQPQTGLKYDYYIKYYEIYKHIVKHKPKELLDLGSGMSTIVMASALYEQKINGKIVAMEEDEEYAKIIKSVIPTHLISYIDYITSPSIESVYGIFSGRRYKNIPKREYDFIHVDGPKQAGLFDMDLIFLLHDRPLYAIIDGRAATSWAMKSLLGGKVKISKIKGLSFVSSCTKKDLKLPYA